MGWGRPELFKFYGVRLPSPYIRRLQYLSRQRQTSVSELIRQAIREFLAKEK
jgi:Arc/MetJ-type ribon-helix-helix transcriptional regulator